MVHNGILMETIGISVIVSIVFFSSHLTWNIVSDFKKCMLCYKHAVHI